MVSSDRWRWSKHLIIACSFAFVSGYVDVFSVVRWNVFVTMMSGNTVFMGRVMFGNDPFRGQPHKVVYYIAVMIFFQLGSVAFHITERKFPNRGASVVAAPLCAIMFAIESLVFADPAKFNLKVIVLGYTPLFGVLSSACVSGRLGTTTTMATGHLLNLSNLLTKRCLDGPLPISDLRKAQMSVAIVACLVAGAMVAALIQVHVINRNPETHGWLLPVGPVLFLLFLAHDHLAKPRSLVKRLQGLKRQGSASERSATGGSGSSAGESEGDDQEEEDQEHHHELDDTSNDSDSETGR